jgi:hypothetical protein
LNTRRGWSIFFQKLLSRKSSATSLSSLCDWYLETQTSRQLWRKEAKTLILGKHGGHSVIVSPTCFALQPVWPTLCLEQWLWRLISRTRERWSSFCTHKLLSGRHIALEAAWEVATNLQRDGTPRRELAPRCLVFFLFRCWLLVVISCRRRLTASYYLQ